MAPFIKSTMYPRSYAYFHDFAADNNLEADRTRDVLEGIVRYSASELWYEYSQDLGDFGFPYRVSPDEPVRDVRLDPDWYQGIREAFPTFIHGYLLTGDQEFLRKGRLLLKGVAWGQNDWNYNFPEKEALAHLLQHTNEYAVWRDLPLAIQSAGSAHTLSWTAPPGARQFWVKYSDKPIVPWLGFNCNTRSFEFSPSSYTPFFAAQNLTNEPAPAQPGTRQELQVTGLSPNTNWFFAARYLAAPESAVPARPVLDSFGLNGQRQFAFQWQSLPGTSYQVQTSTNLVSWVDVVGSIQAIGSVVRWTDTNASSPHKFYRVKVWALP
jgi:hypothetical protein